MDKKSTKAIAPTKPAASEAAPQRHINVQPEASGKFNETGKVRFSIENQTTRSLIFKITTDVNGLKIKPETIGTIAPKKHAHLKAKLRRAANGAKDEYDLAIETVEVDADENIERTPDELHAIWKQLAADPRNAIQQTTLKLSGAVNALKKKQAAKSEAAAKGEDQSGGSGRKEEAKQTRRMKVK